MYKRVDIPQGPHKCVDLFRRSISNAFAEIQRLILLLESFGECENHSSICINMKFPAHSRISRHKGLFEAILSLKVWQFEVFKKLIGYVESRFAVHRMIVG